MEPWTSLEDEDLPDILPGEVVHNDNGDLSFKVLSQVKKEFKLESECPTDVLFKKTLKTYLQNSYAFSNFLENLKKFIFLNVKKHIMSILHFAI